MPGDLVYDEQLRAAAFDHLTRLLDDSPDGSLASADINRFQFQGRTVPLVVQTGIWKPAVLEAALSIRTTYTPPSQFPPYADDIGDDGLLRYKWRGTDAQHSDNRALRVAMQRGAPLVYFVGVDRGVYVPRYPVWLVGEDQQRREFTGRRRSAARGPGRVGRATTGVRPTVDHPAPAPADLSGAGAARVRRSLRHVPAAPCGAPRCGAHPSGHAPARDAVVPNGLALCKIHHAAYDRNILGVRPDLQVDVQPRVLAEIDGPMLRYGLQEMGGVRLLVPRRVDAQADPDRLGERYREFLAVG